MLSDFCGCSCLGFAIPGQLGCLDVAAGDKALQKKSICKNGAGGSSLELVRAAGADCGGWEQGEMGAPWGLCSGGWTKDFAVSWAVAVRVQAKGSWRGLEREVLEQPVPLSNSQT